MFRNDGMNRKKDTSISYLTFCNYKCNYLFIDQKINILKIKSIYFTKCQVLHTTVITIDTNLY